MIGIVFIVSWVTFIMLPFFAWLNYKGWLRADALDEIVGLDVSYHNGEHFLLGQRGNNEVDKEAIAAFKAS